MARTVRAAEQAVRREAFVDVALRLIQTKGYEAMSVQDVLDELNASKGAFYHYFDSKAALLEAAIERIADMALATLEPMLNDAHLSAPEKFDGFFNGIANWKSERSDLMLALIEVYASDANAIVREKVRRVMTDRVALPLAAIIEQGVEEGQFTVSSPQATARVIVALILAFQDEATRLYLARRAAAATFAEVERWVVASMEAWERVLGVAPGVLKGVDREMLRFWFG